MADSLTLGGFRCWTPATVEHRLPAIFAPRKARAEVRVPLLPTYVFAAAGQLGDLLSTSSDPMSNHPAFSVFHFDRRIPLIADDDLRGLRMSERKRMSKEKQRKYRKGDAVTLQDGAWAGMSGIVEKDRGEYVLVTFDRLEVRIARFLLDDDKLAA